MWHINRFIAVFCAVLAMAAPVMGDDLANALNRQVSEGVIISTRTLLDAGADPDLVLSTTRQLHDSGFSDARIRQAHELMLAVHQDDLALGPLVDKINEGISKQIAPDRILNVLATVHARQAYAYARATTVTGAEDKRRSLAGLVSAGLAAGLDKSQMDTIVTSVTNRSAKSQGGDAGDYSMEAVAAARDMARLGVPPDTVSTIVSQAVIQGYSAEEFSEMRTAFLSSSGRSSALVLAEAYSGKLSASKSQNQQQSGQQSGHAGTGNSSAGSGGGSGPGGGGGSGGGSGGGGGGAGGGGSGGGSGGGGGGSGGGGSGGGGGGAGGGS